MPAPGQFLPRASHAHRVACKALYRSLLTHTPHIPLPPNLPPRGPINPLTHLVRKKFKQHASLESPKLIVGALKIGYLINDLLHSATQNPGPSPALEQIHEYLLQNAADVARAREVCTQSAPKEKPYVKAWPGAGKVLEMRPLPLEKLSSGRRTVPSLTSAHGIPFLRFKKKQSAYLGRVIRDKVKKKLGLSRALERAEEVWGWSAEEEKWERVVENVMRDEEMGMGKGGFMDREKDWGMGWTDAYRAEEKRVWTVINKEQNKNKAVGDKMVEIVEKEKELWAKEREERKERKWEDYLRRKEENTKARTEN